MKRGDIMREQEATRLADIEAKQKEDKERDAKRLADMEALLNAKEEKAIRLGYKKSRGRSRSASPEPG